MLHFSLRRSQNVHWQALDVGRETHAGLKNQKPAVLWFTGLSGAGKSTIANLVEKRLVRMNRHTFLLDGDNVRHGLNKDLGFTEADRVENIRRVGEVAKLMTDAGLIVLTAFISPFRAERQMVRDMMAAGRVHRDLHRHALGRGRGARREGPVQKGPRRPAEELHRHRQPLRAADRRRNTHRHHEHDAGRGRRPDRRDADPMSEFLLQSTDVDLAGRIAATAGNLLLELQRSGLFAGKALGRAGDRTANAFIMAALAAQRPEDAVLSEEEQDNPVRLSASRVWIVDPLDGTREYGEARTDWAVHVALAVDGVPVAGAVALPGLGVTYVSAPGQTIPPAPARRRMLVSRTRPAAEAVSVAKALDAELVPMGSAGAKTMAILRGEADIYLHSGGQYEWDNCAPAAVALAAGLHVSRIDGTPLVYNNADPYLPDLLICRQEDAARVLALLAA